MIIENKNWFKNTFLLSILFILLIFLLTVMLEFYLSKFIGLGEPVVYDQSRVWGYSPKPNKKYERFEGDLVTINDVGLRSTKSWKNETKLKHLFLGDSVLYGGSNINDDQLKSIDGEIKLIVSEASEFAEKSNLPDKEELMTDVYL